MSACTATDVKDYVERAVAIAGDRSLKETIGTALRERCGTLFSNPAGPQEMEEFFLDAARRAEAGPP